MVNPDKVLTDKGDHYRNYAPLKKTIFTSEFGLDGSRETRFTNIESEAMELMASLVGVSRAKF